MKEEKAMKKIYNAPEADLLCFRPVEGLAADLNFDTMLSLQPGEGGRYDAATKSDTDIKISI